MRGLRTVGLAVALACAGAAAIWQGAPVRASAAGQTSTAAKPVSSGPNHYINPAVCAECHADIAKSFARTGMGRSFAPVTAATFGHKLPAKPYFHAPSQIYYTIVEHGQGVYMRRWQIGYNGKPTNVRELRIDYVLGSGNHGQTFLHRTARNTLEELPFAWYAENGGTWAMNPGYDRPDHPDSTRLVQAECMFCHNGYPTDAAGHPLTNVVSQFPATLPHGIDCQRCHGPGARHVELVSHGGTLQQIQNSIVNPAHLSPQREMEICMECHLETTSLLLPHSLRRVGRAPFSYIPGQPLPAFELNFDRAPGKNTRFEIDSAAYRLMKSQCFIQTQKLAPAHGLQCTTCHDPHVPYGQTTQQQYNAVCASCHAAEATPGKVASHPSNPDCISCHMPKRRTADAVHIVMTDHLIQLRPPAHPLAPKKETFESTATSYKGEVVPFYPAHLAPTEQNQLDLAVAQVKDDSNLKAGIVQLSALIAKDRPFQAAYYLDLADALHDAGDPPRAAAMYRAALAHSGTVAETATIRMRFANAQMGWQQWSNAEATLRQVVRETPKDPVAWTLLGESLYQQDQDAEATRDLTLAVALDPNSAEPHNYLGALRMRAGDAAGAEAEFRQALDIQPNVAQWQANLAGLLASEGRLPEARFLFELSLRLDPDSLGARLNYARLLITSGDNADGETQARAAVKIDPNNADARDLLGYTLTAQGDGAAAVRELRAAVRLRPQPWRAQLDLAAALRLTGDGAGAEQQLRVAAQSSDPALRAAAQQMLAQPAK